MPDDRRVPATGSSSPRDTKTASEEEPVVTGALFLSMVLLILVAGAWIVMFRMLLER
jgi:hypothetical protein